MVNYKVYEDEEFTSGDSPVILDFLTDLGVKPRSLSVRVIGQGDISISMTFDGVTFEDEVRFEGDESASITDRPPKIRLTHTGTDSGYRVVVIA